MLWTMNQRMLQFLKSTSIKGVPRIFQTKSYFLRTLWTISTISFISMAVYQTCLLTREYLEYPTIVSIKERNLDLVGATHQAIRLPDITLCNMNPFAVDTRNITSLPSLESYYLRVREITECTTCTQEEQNSLWELRQALQTTSGYYTHIGRNNVQRISHREDMFLASCTLEVAKGMTARKVRCERIATIKRYIDSMYYNCYTLQIPPATPTDIVWGVVVVLHLNNHPDILEQQKYLASHYMPGQMAGAVMAFHEHDQKPVLVLTGISLPPGQYMSTKLRFILNKRMEHPYGICRHYDSTISYHQMSCYSTCLQKEVYRECGCYEYTGWNPLIEDSDLDGPPCLSLKRGKQWLYEKWRCLKEVHIRSSTVQNCKFLCPIPCEQFLYDYDITYAAWPTSPYHDTFYEDHISGRPYEHHYRFVRDKTMWNTSAEEHSVDSQTLSSNFLGVHIYLDQYLMMEYKTVPQLSIPAFFSQLGGALNLWAGITIVVIIELLDLVYRVFVDWKKPVAEESVDSPKVTPSVNQGENIEL